MDTSKLSRRYIDSNARDYDAKRIGVKKWQVEERIVKEILGRFPKGTHILDVPVGTGRFIPFYKDFDFKVTGMDVSNDMLEESQKKVVAENFEVDLKQGSIFEIDFPEGHFNIVLCIRFLNWVDFENLSVAIKEIVRVASDSLIVGVRHLAPMSDLEVYTPRGMMRFIRQQYLLHLRKSFQCQELVFHKKQEIEGLFKKYNLQITEAACVEKRADGTDYFIYLLNKEPQDD
jgi:ubiquinone/menaquinone biosynthesis C-methylase UbiE